MKTCRHPLILSLWNWPTPGMAGRHFRLFVASLLLIGVGPAWGEVRWYFNWYCAGCSKIGARTTGTEGPFSSESSCESARSSMRSMMGSRGGGVDTMPCSSQGIPDTPRQPGGGGYGDGGYREQERGNYGYSPPAYDYEAERRAQEAADAERTRRAEEEERQRRAEEQGKQQFLKDRNEAARLLKGGGGPSALKDTAGSGLTLKDTGDGAPGATIDAWKQLYCANSLGLSAIAAARKPVPYLDEVRFLGEQIAKALNGNRLDVACPSDVPPPAVYKQARLESSHLLKVYAQLMQGVTEQATALMAANGKLDGLGGQKAMLSQQTAFLRANPLPLTPDVVDLSDRRSDVVNIRLLQADDGSVPPGGKKPNGRVVIPLPSVPKPSAPLWIAGVPYYLPTVEEFEAAEARRIANLAMIATEKLLAEDSKTRQKRAARLNEFWFEESLRKMRDTLLVEERRTQKEVVAKSFERLSAEMARQKAQLDIDEAKRKEGERLLAQAGDKIRTEELNARGKAMERALASMRKDYQAMEAKGLFKSGDDLVQKEREDSRFREALAAASLKANKQLDNDYLDARHAALRAYGEEADRLRHQGLLPEIDVAARDRALALARDEIVRREEDAITAARMKTTQVLEAEYRRLKPLEPQMLRKAETAVKEMDQLIRKAQDEERQANARLGQYQQRMEELLANPNAKSFIAEPAPKR